jgi:hypothetical protein
MGMASDITEDIEGLDGSGGDSDGGGSVDAGEVTDIVNEDIGNSGGGSTGGDRGITSGEGETTTSAPDPEPPGSSTGGDRGITSGGGETTTSAPDPEPPGSSTGGDRGITSGGGNTTTSAPEPSGGSDRSTDRGVTSGDGDTASSAPEPEPDPTSDYGGPAPGGVDTSDGLPGTAPDRDDDVRQDGVSEPGRTRTDDLGVNTETSGDPSSVPGTSVDYSGQKTPDPSVNQSQRQIDYVAERTSYNSSELRGVRETDAGLKPVPTEAATKTRARMGLIESGTPPSAIEDVRYTGDGYEAVYTDEYATELVTERAEEHGIDPDRVTGYERTPDGYRATLEERRSPEERFRDTYREDQRPNEGLDPGRATGELAGYAADELVFDDGTVRASESAQSRRLRERVASEYNVDPEEVEVSRNQDGELEASVRIGPPEESEAAGERYQTLRQEGAGAAAGASYEAGAETVVTGSGTGRASPQEAEFLPSLEVEPPSGSRAAAWTAAALLPGSSQGYPTALFGEGGSAEYEGAEPVEATRRSFRETASDLPGTQTAGQTAAVGAASFAPGPVRPAATTAAMTATERDEPERDPYRTVETEQRTEERFLPSVESTNQGVEYESGEPVAAAGESFDRQRETLTGNTVGAAAAGAVAAPEPVSTGAGAAALGGIAAVEAGRQLTPGRTETVRAEPPSARSELEPSGSPAQRTTVQPGTYSPELDPVGAGPTETRVEPGDRTQTTTVEPGSFPDEASPTQRDEPGRREAPRDDGYTPDEYPQAGRDYPRDPSQDRPEQVDRSDYVPGTETSPQQIQRPQREQRPDDPVREQRQRQERAVPEEFIPERDVIIGDEGFGPERGFPTGEGAVVGRGTGDLEWSENAPDVLDGQGTRTGQRPMQRQGLGTGQDLRQTGQQVQRTGQTQAQTTRQRTRQQQRTEYQNEYQTQTPTVTGAGPGYGFERRMSQGTGQGQGFSYGFPSETRSPLPGEEPRGQRDPSGADRMPSSTPGSGLLATGWTGETYAPYGGPAAEAAYDRPEEFTAGSFGEYAPALEGKAEQQYEEALDFFGAGGSGDGWL